MLQTTTSEPQPAGHFAAAASPRRYVDNPRERRASPAAGGVGRHPMAPRVGSDVGLASSHHACDCAKPVAVQCRSLADH
jgi:hypothetical protein